MKKLILKWIFGTDDIDRYFTILNEYHECNKECIELINGHLKTLDEERENLTIMRKLIEVCENHGINPDEEIKKINLDD